MCNDEKWPNMLQVSCSVNIAGFLKYVWLFSLAMLKRVKELSRAYSEKWLKLWVSKNSQEKKHVAHLFFESSALT